MFIMNRPMHLSVVLYLKRKNTIWTFTKRIMFSVIAINNIVLDNKPQLLWYRCCLSTFIYFYCLHVVVFLHVYKTHATHTRFLVWRHLLEARQKTKTCNLDVNCNSSTRFITEENVHKRRFNVTILKETTCPNYRLSVKRFARFFKCCVKVILTNYSILIIHK